MPVPILLEDKPHFQNGVDAEWLNAVKQRGVSTEARAIEIIDEWQSTGESGFPPMSLKSVQDVFRRWTNNHHLSDLQLARIEMYKEHLLSLPETGVAEVTKKPSIQPTVVAGKTVAFKDSPLFQKRPMLPAAFEKAGIDSITGVAAAIKECRGDNLSLSLETLREHVGNALALRPIKGDLGKAIVEAYFDAIERIKECPKPRAAEANTPGRLIGSLALSGKSL